MNPLVDNRFVSFFSFLSFLRKIKIKRERERERRETGKYSRYVGSLRQCYPLLFINSLAFLIDGHDCNFILRLPVTIIPIINWC
jgi:hypothetical protein